MKYCRIVFIFSLFFIMNCSERKIDPNTVTVSILPQKYFVQRIGGKEFNVNVMVPPGQSPATHEITTNQMIDLSRSSIYFLIGHIPFETVNMERFKSANPELKLVDTSKGIRLIRGHHHGDGDKHNLNIDPHVWVSPKGAMTIAKNILNALTVYRPGKKVFFRNNYISLVKDIEKLDTSITKSLTNCRRNTFIVFHPVWSYFARDYNLKQIAIEKDGKEPDPLYMKSIIDIAKKKGIKNIIIQKQFPAHYAQSIASDIGGRVISLDPLAPEWLGNMTKIAETFGSILNE